MLGTTVSKCHPTGYLLKKKVSSRERDHGQLGTPTQRGRRAPGRDAERTRRQRPGQRV